MQSQGAGKKYDVGTVVQLPKQTDGTTTGAESASEEAAGMEVEGGFYFKAPMDNLVIKTFQFPVR